MMPGENHSKIAGVASDATTGTCQNCTVLQQNLDEYIAALLSLKQKIIDSDHLLTEYEEKCDELQRCQRETSVLHQQLDELLDKMVVLEKQNDSCEMIQAELQEKKSIIHKLEQKCVTMDALKEENLKAVALNVNLGNQLKKLEETSTSQNNENAILKSEKEALEKELQEAQNSAKLYERAAAEVQRLKEENTRTLTLKESAETQLQIFKDSRLRQIREIEQLKLDKETLKRRLHKTQKHLEKLERESQKDVRNASAQTNHSREPTVDKAKVRSLLEDLWKCVEPHSTQTTNFSLFCEENVKHDYDGRPKEVPGSPLQRQNSQPVSNRTPTKSVNTSAVPSATKGTGAEEKVSRKRRRSRSSEEQLAGSVAMDETMWPAVQENNSLPSRLSPALKVARQEMEEFDTEHLLGWLKPLPPPLSPISSPCSKESVLGHISDSSDDEEDESTDRKMISTEMPNVGVFLNRDEFGTNSSVDQNVDSRIKSCAEMPLLPSERDMMGSLATSSCTPSVQVSLSTETEPFRSDSVDVGDLETPNAQGATRLALTLQQDKEPKEVHTPCEDSLPVLKVHRLEDHRGRPGITPSPSAPELCQSGCTEDKVCMNSSNADPAKEGAMDVQTSLDVSNVIKEPLLVNSGQSAGLSEGGMKTFASKSMNEEPRKESDSTLEDGGVEVLEPNDQEMLSNSCVENKDGIHFSEHMPVDMSKLNFVEGSILSNTAPLLKEEIADVKEDCHQVTPNIAARDIQKSFTSPVPLNDKGSPGSKVSDMEIDCGGSEPSANDNGSEKGHLTKNGKANEQGDTLQLFEPECLLKTAVSVCTSDTNRSAETEGKGSDDSVTCHGKRPDTPDLPVIRLSVGCITEDSDSSVESSDEQESCKLQRKVRRMCQRGSSQGPVGKRDMLSETVTDCKSGNAGCKDLQDIARKQPLNKELVSTHTHADTLKDNVDLEMEDLEDGGIKMVKCESVFGVEGYDCEMVTVSETLNVAKLNDQKIKDEVPLQSFEMKEETSFTNANPEGFLRPSPVSENTDEKTDISKIIERKDTECPIDVAQTEAFKHESLPGHAWQCSGKVQEDLKANVNVQESVLESNVLSGSLKLKSPECLTKVRSEMGPPLPPLLMPLSATPRRPRILDSRSFPGKLSFSSPTNELSSPQKGNSVSAVPSPDGSSAQGRSPSMAAKSPSDMKCGRTLSSPLQFCSATPKHAVPVPGRFPTSALGSSVTPSGATHENSVRILDTMYPELSARARTLNILRGNVNLGRPAPENGTAPPGTVNQITGYKSINSSSTAFTKTGKSCESESGSPEEELTGDVKANDATRPSAPQVGKRAGVNLILPSSAKKLQLEGDSPPPVGVVDTVQPLADSRDIQPVASKAPKEGSEDDKKQLDTSVSTVDIISKALMQIETSCFDLLPVIKSHVSIRRISTVPILRDEERNIICQFSEVNKTLADDFLSAILAKMKTEKKSLGGDHLQALCRVYTGVCRQKGEWQRVHLLVYSILKEDFPDSAKLVLFIVTTWYNVLLPQLGVVCNAIHAVLRKRAEGEVLQYLTAYLSWETNPPCDVQKIIMNSLVALQLGTNMKFQYHERHGSDLNQAAWDYIFAMDLLCNQMRWTWTYDNLICKELWPVMNKWVTQQRIDMTVQDVSVASVLRLIGRLGQLGIKEKHLASVRHVAQVINTFGRHGKSEGVPWEVQLAAVYTIYDLSPSNPKEALEALAAWRGETTLAVPPAVTSCITQIGSICRQVKP